MQKIIVEKDEAVADLIERILESDEKEIRLVVPKKSHLLDSPNNFRLLAREANVLSKLITVESVDENVLKLAKETGLVSTHPLFDERMEGEGERMTDIVPVDAADNGRRKKRAPAGAVPLKVQYEAAPEEEDEPAEATEAEEAVPVREEERYDTLADNREPRSRRWVWLALGVVVILLAGGWLFGKLFGKASAEVVFQRTPWTYNGPVAALTSVKGLDADRSLVPGQIFEEEKSLVQAFPASGRANVNIKAKGSITIVNSYSSAPQELVARTRFETPDGKIFRLDNGVIVPGAQIKDGKITPSSIKAPVTADMNGAAGNVGRVDKLTVPGFKGSPKFDGFYGILENGASGGATGERAVATDADVQKAEAKTLEVLQASFQSSFLGNLPSDMKVLDGAAALIPGKVTVDRTAGTDGNFNVTANAVFEAFGFREKDLHALLAAQTTTTPATARLENLELAYSGVQADFSKKELKFSVAGKGDLTADFDPEAFRSEIAGQKRDGARSTIMSLPGLTEARLTLWPAWLRSLPQNPDRIVITVK